MNEIYRQFAGVFLVLATLAGVLWFAKRRGMARFTFGASSSARRVRILERIPLTPQHTLHLLAIGSRRLLLTSAPGSCQLIIELPEERQQLEELSP